MKKHKLHILITWNGISNDLKIKILIKEILYACTNKGSFISWIKMKFSKAITSNNICNNYFSLKFYNNNNTNNLKIIKHLNCKVCYWVHKCKPWQIAF